MAQNNKTDCETFGESAKMVALLIKAILKRAHPHLSFRGG